MRRHLINAIVSAIVALGISSIVHSTGFETVVVMVIFNILFEVQDIPKEKV